MAELGVFGRELVHDEEGAIREALMWTEETLKVAGLCNAQIDLLSSQLNVRAPRCTQDVKPRHHPFSSNKLLSK